MASETEALLKEMREILSSMKDVSQFARDLTQTLGQVARPLQQSSDFMKAMAEQSDKANENNSAILESIKAYTTEMHGSVELLKERNKLTEEARKTKAEILAMEKENLITSTQDKEAKKQEEATEKEKNKAKQRAQEEHNLLWKTQVSLIDEAKNKVKDLQEWLVKSGYEVRELENGMKEVSAKSGFGALLARQAPRASHLMTGDSDMSSAMAGIASKMSSTFLPVMGIGGLIGMMIHGVHRQEQFRAIGEQAAQQFDAIGGHSEKLAGRLGGLARQFETFGYGSAQDIIAVSQAMREYGIAEGEATKQVEGFNSAIGGDFIALTLASDKALELAAGTTAKYAGVLKTDFNEAAEQGAMKLLNLGTAAKNAGLNAATFMQQTMDAASSIRLLNVNWSDLGEIQLKMVNVMKDRGFNEQFSSSYASKGAAGLANSMAGMDDGMAAILGERMSGGRMTGLDAIYRFQSPMARGDLNMEDFVKAIRSVLSEVGGSDAEKWRFLTKGPMKMDGAAADMVMAAVGELGKSGSLSDTTKKGLGRAVESETAKRNRMDQNIEIIKDAVATIMVGLLGMVINGLKALYNLVVYIGAIVEKGFSLPGSNTTELDQLIALSKKNMGRNIDHIGDSAKGMGPAFEQIAKATGSQLKLHGINDNDMTPLLPAIKAQWRSTNGLTPSTQQSIDQKAVDAYVGRVTSKGGTKRVKVNVEIEPEDDSEKNYNPGIRFE